MQVVTRNMVIVKWVYSFDFGIYKDIYHGCKAKIYLDLDCFYDRCIGGHPFSTKLCFRELKRESLNYVVGSRLVGFTSPPSNIIQAFKEGKDGKKMAYRA
jgi:hypothetical protein